MTDVKRLFDFPYYQLEKFNLEKSLVNKQKGEWVATSTQEYIGSKSIAKWKKQKIDLTKRPCIFILGDTFYN